MGSIYSLADFLDMIRRRFWVIVAISVLGGLASLWYAINQTQTYSSSEVIQISRPKIAGELAKSTVDGSSARRMQLIQQRLMARGTILEVVEQLGLFADRPDLLGSQIVPIMRNSITIDGTAAAREGYTDDGSMSVLTITARMPSPEEAQAVAREFSRRTIELSVATRIDQARETLMFFTEKEAALAKEIAALEEEIANFRHDNAVTLPGAIQMRGSEITAINESLLGLAREEIELRSLAEEAAATQREAYARRVREEYDAQREALAAQRQLLEDRRDALEASLELTPDVDRQLSSYERKMDQMQTELQMIIARRADAEVGFRLETARQGERLTVIEPAPLPDYAVGSGRKSTAIKGGMISVALAIIAAFLLDLKTPALRSSAQMNRETGLIPVVTIPVLDTRRPGLLRRMLRRDKAAGTGSARA
ncbi:Wzz/FepE/Etk N-terminal domain-containing protein [Tritonibacter horizontis]|uniref:Chain length determinant protein n=1 Tax=Tritonibacter horizontis TaxID=1768241 RepID=A0A132BXG2_9RHOB|nr:Wzz/FepE/Etk N-terminal domain-containing protein [Tritonibacter horizontis]KUP92430.1 chain length determinant protein [Tritonibacter horizontis]